MTNPDFSKEQDFIAACKKLNTLVEMFYNKINDENTPLNDYLDAKMGLENEVDAFINSKAALHTRNDWKKLSSSSEQFRNSLTDFAPFFSQLLTDHMHIESALKSLEERLTTENNKENKRAFDWVASQCNKQRDDFQKLASQYNPSNDANKYSSLIKLANKVSTYFEDQPKLSSKESDSTTATFTDIRNWNVYFENRKRCYLEHIKNFELETESNYVNIVNDLPDSNFKRYLQQTLLLHAYTIEQTFAVREPGVTPTLNLATLAREIGADPMSRAPLLPTLKSQEKRGGFGLN